MKSLLKIVSASLLLSGIASTTNAQNVMEHFVLDGKEAVAVLPSELIAAPTVKHVYSSHDGNCLIVLREKMKITPDILPDGTNKPMKLPEGEQELIYWNARTRTARSFWKSPLFEVAVRDVVWMPQTETVYAVTQSVPKPLPNPDASPFKPEWKLLKMTEGQTRATELALPDPGSGGYVSLSASTKLPLVILHIMQNNNEPARPDGSVINKTLTYLLRRDGRIETPLAIPDASEARMILPTWDKEGKPAIYWVGAGKKRAHYAVNPANFALIPIEGKFENQEYAEPDRTHAGVLLLKSQKLTATIGETQKPLPVLWLESSVPSEFPRLLLSGDATEGSLMSKGDGALYQSQGALWFAPFIRLDQAQFLAARLAALKQVAMSNARQAGLGLMMYAQDYDETFPDADGIKDKVLPYVKNEAIFDGFNYTYPGGKLADIDKPAETLLGFVAGPGGRANIYADGHVKWADEPKK